VTTIGSFSNASSSVLPTSANSGGVSFLYGYNGASWDQLQVDGGKNLMVNCVVGCFSGSLTSGAATIGSIANTGFNVTGTLPAFASIPTVNIGSGSVSVSGAVAQTGAWTTSVTQSNAANLTATVVGTGTFAVQATGNVGGLTGVGQSGSLTRPANTTTYGAGGKAVCASISNNCAPLQVTIAGATSATGTGANVIMLKSGSSTLNAGFNIYFYSAMPTVAGVHDASAYLGPYAADVPYLVGIYSCATPILTNDGTPQVFFRCASTSPTGWEQYQTVAGQRFVYAMISVTGPYAPASAETFTIYANSYQDK